MAKSSNPIPKGCHSVTPFLIVRDSVKAIEFYKQAFGAEERYILQTPDGKTMHAEIQIGDSVIMMNDEFPERGCLGPESRGGATGSLMIYLTDVDVAYKKAVDAGCTVVMPLQDMFWGDRWGQLTDPFGHTWSLATHIEDVPPEEMGKRMETACKQMAEACSK